MKKERRKTVLIQNIFHSFSAENFVTRSSTKGVYFRICVHKRVGSKKAQGMRVLCL